MKRIFWVLIIIIIFVFTIVGLASAKDYEFYTNQSTVLIEKVLEADFTGKDIIITDRELNELINKVIDSRSEFGDVKINKFNVIFQDEELKLISNFSVKKLSFQLSTTGKIQIDDKYIYFIPETIKLGKIKLPHRMIFKLINNNQHISKFIIDNKVKFDKNILVFNFEEIKISKSQMIIKTQNMQNNNLAAKQINSNIDNTKSIETKEIENNSNITKNKTVKSPEQKNNRTISQSNITKEENKQTLSVQDQKKKQLLIELNQQLTSTISKLSDDKQKSVVRTIQTTINKMISNPSYNYSNDIGKVKQRYHSLNQEQKNELVTKLLINTSPALRSELMAIFLK